MKSLELTLDDYGMGLQRRKDHAFNVMSKAKVRILAYYGAFDGIFNHEQKRQAKLFGALPKGYDVHHIIPLCCENTSYFLSNMVVMETSAHKWLHRNIINPQLAKCQPHQSCSVWIPDFNYNELFTMEKLQPFIESWTEHQIALRVKGEQRCR